MVDARGLSCPMPVLMTQKAMKSGEDSYEVLVDSMTPCENVTRYAQSQGYNVSVEEQDGDYLLRISR